MPTGKEKKSTGEVLGADDTADYMLTSETEGDRLDRQGLHMDLPGIMEHLRPYLRNVNIVIDAGSGSGVIARYMIKEEGFDGRVVGLDINIDHLNHAREKARNERIPNMDHVRGNLLPLLNAKGEVVQRLPFKDDSVDLVWTKYVLRFLNDPRAAVGEFKRVTRPGGHVVLCDCDSILTLTYPINKGLINDTKRMMSYFSEIGALDYLMGRKLYFILHSLGFKNIKQEIVPDPLFTWIGGMSEYQRQNLTEMAEAAWPLIVKSMHSEKKAKQWLDGYMDYQSREDAMGFTPLFFVTGEVP